MERAVMTASPLIRLSDIEKRFGETQALAGVSFELAQGEIHALLGENGAGKTTLMHVLYGLIRPDAGTMEVEGRPVAFLSPRQAIRAGIGMVHQHFMLIPTLTVAENIWMGAREKNPFWFHRRTAVEETRRLAETFALKMDPTREIRELPVGVQQRVEILKCLAREARIFILDEPTAVLTPQEVDELALILRRLREAGRSVIFISHKLREVLDICDRVTILRAGRNVGTLPVRDVDERSLSAMMVGRTLKEIARAPGVPPSREAALRLDRIVVRDSRGQVAVNEADVSVHAGEIYGLAGIDGNGQQELLEALAGVRKIASGRVLLERQDITDASPRERIERGIALISDDRQRKGLVLEATVAENLVLKAYRTEAFAEHGFLKRGEIRRFALERVGTFGVKTASVESAAGFLSGGNQQKVVVAREMRHAATLLIAANPTRGLDIGATEFVHQTLRKARAAGLAILLISTELDEILSLSDRIGVLYDGRIHELPPGTSDRTTIGQWMLGRAT